MKKGNLFSARAFPIEEDCAIHLAWLRWGDHIVSPFHKDSRVYRYGTLYMCKKTNKYFTVKTGTIFYHTKLPLPYWFLAIYYLQRDLNISSYKLAALIDLPQHTANTMLHRLHFATAIAFKDANPIVITKISFDDLLQKIVLVEIGIMKW